MVESSNWLVSRAQIVRAGNEGLSMSSAAGLRGTRPESTGTPGRRVAATSIRMVIVIGVRLYRDGVSAAFRRQADFDVVAIGSDASDAAELVGTHEADVALLDLSGHDRPQVVRAVRAARDGVRVVILGIDESAEDVIPLFEAGTAGYVTREASLHELLDVARRAVNGEAMCSPRVVASLAARLAELAEQRSGRLAVVDLTAREREIGALIERGLSNKQIACRLCIEVPTVKNHVHHILGKLQVERRGAAAALLRA
jgi:two-component system, NarL family, nitrate/nitrite response regulator NarL